MGDKVDKEDEGDKGDKEYFTSIPHALCPMPHAPFPNQ
ncbi:histidine kinase [Nostoc sp. CMAA1605]|nr:histidine kinase [Nostoc sp. CMAA1605]